MPYGFLADGVAVVHVLYVGFVVLGQLAILAGCGLRWGWVRNPWFRWTHLAAICIVAAEALLGMTCPLTDWEDALRKLAGQQPGQGSFVGRLLDDLLFLDLPEGHWAFPAAHIGFAVLVLLTFWLAPPRRSAETTESLPGPPGVPSV